MSSAPAVRRILFVAPKREAQPVLSQLRSSGHQVSLVEDLDEAGAILGISGFDQAVLLGGSLEFLLEQKVLWDSDDGEGWRRSTAAIVHDLRGLLSAISRVMQGVADPAQSSAISGTVATLSTFAEELMQELVASPNSESIAIVDLEDVAEAAAVVVYPFATDRRQRLIIDIDSEVAEIKTSGSRLKRALKNILEFVSSRAPDRGGVSIRATREGDDCVISVSCDGKAVTRTELGRIFSRASAFGGRAGPLVLAQELVEPIGGRMWIESEKGAGVSAFLALPHRKRRAPVASPRGSEDA
jgi:K+-sensing histidine kinase KdpD